MSPSLNLLMGSIESGAKFKFASRLSSSSLFSFADSSSLITFYSSLANLKVCANLACSYSFGSIFRNLRLFTGSLGCFWAGSDSLTPLLINWIVTSIAGLSLLFAFFIYKSSSIYVFHAPREGLISPPFDSLFVFVRNC